MGRVASVQRKSGCPLTIRLLGRTEIRRLAKELEFRPRKSLGQNFVHDANTVRRVVSTSGVGRSDSVMEVGPGLGSLTLALLDRGATVTAVEIDPVLADRLPQTVAEHSHSEIHRLTVLNRDVLSLRRGRFGPKNHHGVDGPTAPTSPGRQPAVQRRGPGAAAPAGRISVDPDFDGDGAGRGCRTACRRAGRQGVWRAQRQGALLRPGAPLRHGVADGVLADPAGVFRAGAHRSVRHLAVAHRRNRSASRCSNWWTSHSPSGARHLATRSPSGRARATNRRTDCWPPASIPRVAARR